MSRALPSSSPHQKEIQHNRRVWDKKPLLRRIYAGFYARISRWIDAAVPGQLVEIGSGIGNLKTHQPKALSTDLCFNPWLDLVCDAYELPFAEDTISHLLLFDVFHHLQAPRCFLNEARRVLGRGGRLILLEPYISWASSAVYGCLHPEPIAWRRKIEIGPALPRPRAYYAAQGNATRVFFNREIAFLLEGWSLVHAEAFASFSYLLSGGFSRPSFYPAGMLPRLQELDARLSRWPRLFGARCLVILTPARTPAT